MRPRGPENPVCRKLELMNWELKLEEDRASIGFGEQVIDLLQTEDRVRIASR